MAIKIIQRFSKKRRLGRVTVSPEDKTKREIAILKKIRHPNVVGLLEVIDDPELKKIYMVLEHVELGEIVWRKKGSPQICYYERRRIEREVRGEIDTGEEERFFYMMERRRRQKEAKRLKASSALQQHSVDYWSLEHGNDEDDMDPLTRQNTHESNKYSRSHHSSIYRSENGSSRDYYPSSRAASRVTSRAPSRAPSRGSSHDHTPLPLEWDIQSATPNDESETAGDFPRSYSGQPLSNSNNSSAAALDVQSYGSFLGEGRSSRGRSPSMADSIISHMSSVDDVVQHDAFEEDFSFVPCFTLEQARSTFRDTVLGLEYLHYEGIVHRDIKPANLLWTRDHRVKISDFGVSYFGRPIRDGETEENVSESDAKDFDDDLELAKTVGTPAFFAPELCYTDLDGEQPKVSEQIDVWSLGVTLYCLIYARIPFLAEDEYQLFKAIAQQNVYIPTRRLKAVNPAQNASRIDLSNRANTNTAPSTGPYRDDYELEMEDIDDELRDLLRRMLIKDPAERIKLREVKRHPWVLRDIENVIGWLDDTDPSRQTAGRRIQVDDRELERAVVPITFLERARTAVKKAVGKVMGRSETSRKRAVSSATSSGGDLAHHSPSTPNSLGRSSSLRGDDTYFPPVKEPSEHPLAHSVTASPDQPVNHADPFSQSFYSTATIDNPMLELAAKEFENRPTMDRMHSIAASVRTVIGHDHHSSDELKKSPEIEDGSQIKSAPDLYSTFTNHNESAQDIPNAEKPDEAGRAESGRSSMEKFPFSAQDMHSEASVAISHAVAPGSFEHKHVKRNFKPASREGSPTTSDFPPITPVVRHRRPSLLDAQQPHSSPSVMERIYAASITDDRPPTATRTPEGRTPAARIWAPSTAESFVKAQEQLARRRRLEAEAELEKQKATEAARALDPHQSSGSCPPSPDDHIFLHKQREEAEAQRVQSSSSVNSEIALSPITSPSDTSSPISCGNPETGGSRSASDQAFPSHPSLPTLMSGASSVSADTEGDFLANPGVVEGQESLMSSGDSPATLTPPSLSKHVSHETDTTEHIAEPKVAEDNGDGDPSFPDDDKDDSDSDEGLTMSRRKPTPRKAVVRRDTNLSICSTETAKLLPSVD